MNTIVNCRKVDETIKKFTRKLEFIKKSNRHSRIERLNYLY